MSDCINECPVQTTLGVIGGKWKIPVLWHLRDGTFRFTELQRMIAGITPKMLTEQLRQLEKDGLISRKVYATVPPKVEYTLTPYGQSLDPILRAMGMWGEHHLRRSATETVA